MNFGIPPTSLKFYAILIILTINVITIITIIIIIIKKIPSFFIIEMPYLNVYDILVILTINVITSMKIIIIIKKYQISFMLRMLKNNMWTILCRFKKKKFVDIIIIINNMHIVSVLPGYKVTNE